MPPWDWLRSFEFVGSLLFTVALIPQFVHTVRLRRAEGFNVGFLLLVLTASLTMLVYSGWTRQFFLAASFLANLIVWGTVLYYRLRPQTQSFIPPRAVP